MKLFSMGVMIGFTTVIVGCGTEAGTPEMVPAKDRAPQVSEPKTMDVQPTVEQRAEIRTSLRTATPKDGVWQLKGLDYYYGFNQEGLYLIETEDGRLSYEPSHVFWPEMLVHFKTDGSDKGPLPEHPVVKKTSGKYGMRLIVVFARPAEMAEAVARMRASASPMPEE